MSGIGPLDFLTATGNAELMASINGIPVSDLVLGVSAFAKHNVAFPAVNADNFNLGSVASAMASLTRMHLRAARCDVFLVESGRWQRNDSGL